MKLLKICRISKFKLNYHSIFFSVTCFKVEGIEDSNKQEDDKEGDYTLEQQRNVVKDCNIKKICIDLERLGTDDMFEDQEKLQMLDSTRVYNIKKVRVDLKKLKTDDMLDIDNQEKEEMHDSTRVYNISTGETKHTAWHGTKNYT